MLWALLSGGVASTPSHHRPPFHCLRQVYEDTSGLTVGDPVTRNGKVCRVLMAKSTGMGG